MSKAINYETFTLGNIVLWAAPQGIKVAMGHGRAVAETVAEFRSPATLRELAAEITKAADALEKSQQLTFADLKPGEWFRWVQNAHQDYGLRKVDECTVINPDNWDLGSYYRPVVNVNAKDSLVVRIKATFETVKP